MRDPLPSCIGQEVVLCLSCGLANKGLVQLHHALVKVDALLGDELEPGHVALGVLLVVIVTKLSCIVMG